MTCIWNGRIWYSARMYSLIVLITLADRPLQRNSRLGQEAKIFYHRCQFISQGFGFTPSSMPINICFISNENLSSVNSTRKTSLQRFLFTCGTTTCSTNFPRQFYLNLIPVRLSGAEDIIILGHGPGCRPLVDLVNERGQECHRK